MVQCEFVNWDCLSDIYVVPIHLEDTSMGALEFHMGEIDVSTVQDEQSLGEIAWMEAEW